MVPLSRRRICASNRPCDVACCRPAEWRVLRMSLRVAIVGSGRMGRERGRAAKSFGADVVTVCDPDVERAESLALDLDAKPVSCAEDLDMGTLDALFVCTPPSLRGAPELDAIAAGVPVFVEKPMGLNREQCLRLVDAIQAKPVKNAVGYMNRYRESALRAQKAIAESRPIGIAFQWFAARYRVP